jgi:hypothetical protein
MIKDKILDALAETGNVAQFVSFTPSLGPRYSRAAVELPLSLAARIGALMAASSERSLNVRSFIPGDHQSKEFVYGLRTVDDVLANLRRLGDQGLYLIVNETIDIGDGGVSGVVQGDSIEFAPNDTPRCVEKPGACSLPRAVGQSIIETCYGAALPFGPGRYEFSVHPKPRGVRGERVILWEAEPDAPNVVAPRPAWPNRFSEHVGDKAFGLLVAHSLDLPVPQTLVVGRNLPPFRFGDPTGLGVWTRTCPNTQQPGLYTTAKGWLDPFKLMAAEDASGLAIASVLCQDAVRAEYAGAALFSSDGQWLIEGKAGEGDDFMLGSAAPEALPQNAADAVLCLASEIASKLGPARFEWVFDGARAWVVQLHAGQSCSTAAVLVPGEAVEWHELETTDLAKLRSDIGAVPDGHGVILLGRFGLTSHIADVVRKAGKPARLAA